MTEPKQLEALELASAAESADIAGYPTAKKANAYCLCLLEDCAQMIRRLHAENTTLQAGYAAARLEIESLRTRCVEPVGERTTKDYAIEHAEYMAQDAEHQPPGNHGEKPLPLLARDIAADFGVTPVQVCLALAELGFGHLSVNMAITPEMAEKLREYFAHAAQQAPAQAAPELTETAVTAKNPAAPVSSFEDSRTQAVYEVLVNDNYPPAGSNEHCEGWKARLIVDAIFPMTAPAAVAGPSDVVSIQRQAFIRVWDERGMAHQLKGTVETDERMRVLMDIYFPRTAAPTTQPAPSVELGVLQAEIAGHEAANLHLSAMVDELRELLQDAKRAMTELHQAAIPDESAEGVPAIIPPDAFRAFVDAHAKLCFCLHQRGHNPVQDAQQPAHQQEPASVDLKTMELAESVGLIGPASRTHDLHAAIQRFHDLICANATIKAAQMAAEAISEPAPQQEAQEPVGHLRMGPKEEFVATQRAEELGIDVWHPVYTSQQPSPAAQGDALSQSASDVLDEIQRLARFADAATRMASHDMRNNMETLAEELTNLLAAAPAQLAQRVDVLDASRYRWLREASVDRQGTRVIIDERPRFLERLDATIDAARAAQEGK